MKECEQKRKSVTIGIYIHEKTLTKLDQIQCTCYGQCTKSSDCEESLVIVKNPEVIW